MARPNNNITIHRCILKEQAGKVKKAINCITDKDNLSVGETQAIRTLTEVYDVLTNLVQGNRENKEDKTALDDYKEKVEITAENFAEFLNTNIEREKENPDSSLEAIQTLSEGVRMLNQIANAFERIDRIQNGYRHTVCSDNTIR